MFGDVQEFVEVCWKEVLSMVNDAAVYIDHSAAECLHWYTGDSSYLALKDAGAVSVHELALYNFNVSISEIMILLGFFLKIIIFYLLYFRISKLQRPEKL